MIVFWVTVGRTGQGQGSIRLVLGFRGVYFPPLSRHRLFRPQLSTHASCSPIWFVTGCAVVLLCFVCVFDKKKRGLEKVSRLAALG